MSNTEGYRYLNLVGFTVDVLQPLALFKDESDESTFPLWLEMGDVLAITTELVTSRFSGKVEREDLLESVLKTFGYKVSDILIEGTAEEGYRSEVYLDSDDGVAKIPVSLVTALLAAIRYKLPVGVSGEALSSSAFVDRSGDPDVELSDEKRLLEMLERMSPEDMGKYPM